MSESTAGDDTLLALHLPAAPEALDTAHDAFEEAWTEHPDVADDVRLRFVMATMEILGNVVEHAYAPDVRADGRRLALDVTRTATGLVGTISDNGQPFALDLSDVAMPGVDAESGRGLALARDVLDGLDYERVEGRNVWTLRCEGR
ncbi:ATP-binding protein [Nocardioides zeae]|uniref:ATP-binding protein n=1 Tax=Nocardioides imazamoxiresistens TaxID=3231893 RepID=A0ABU3PTF7_9ACTN|nr:ATP-binding protein [Nocardioides zeae]MDT9592469.1 ATP-binding protein [Nocardioides zeae]